MFEVAIQLARHGSEIGFLSWVAAMGAVLFFLQRRQAAQRAFVGEAATSLRAANEELQRIAYRDPLTGLANRVSFEETLNEVAHADERPLTVLFIDLDGFKPINDSFGHACGDALLCEVAARLRMLLRGEDTLARVSADQFLVLRPGDADGAAHLAQRALEALSQPCRV